MEKENKYYDLIEQLIRKHKKFSGLEAILDDIIDDVYSHSEVILKTINNESVVNAYLEKVVSTSIITVPKKMDFHPNVRHAEIKIESIISKPAQKVDNSLVDKMINGTSVVETIPTTAKANVEEKEDDIVFEELDTIEEVLEPIDVSNELENFAEIEVVEKEDEPSFEDTSFTNDNLAEEEKEDFIVDFSESNSENTLEEELTIINDINESETSIVDAAPDNESLIKNVPEEDFETIDLGTDIEPEFSIQPLDIEETEIFQEENSVSEDNIEEDSAEQEQKFTELESFAGDLAEGDVELSFDSQEENNLLTEELDTEPESFADALVQNEILSDDNTEELIAESNEELLISEDDTTAEELSLGDFESDSETLEEHDSNESQNFVPVDYSVFGFNPQKEGEDTDIDTELITKDLSELSDKYPELNILNVYNLKYKENLPVAEVASRLETSENNIIEALNEIIAVI